MTLNWSSLRADTIADDVFTVLMPSLRLTNVSARIRELLRRPDVKSIPGDLNKLTKPA